MNKETFIKILDLQKQHYIKQKTLYDYGLCTKEISSPLIEIINIFWSEVLTELGVESLNFLLYDKNYISGDLNEYLKIWDRDNNEAFRNIHELYYYLLKNNYFKLDKAFHPYDNHLPIFEKELSKFCIICGKSIEEHK